VPPAPEAVTGFEAFLCRQCGYFTVHERWRRHRWLCVWLLIQPRNRHGRSARVGSFPLDSSAWSSQPHYLSHRTLQVRVGAAPLVACVESRGGSLGQFCCGNGTPPLPPAWVRETQVHQRGGACDRGCLDSHGGRTLTRSGRSWGSAAVCWRRSAGVRTAGGRSRST